MSVVLATNKKKIFSDDFVPSSMKKPVPKPPNPSKGKKVSRVN